MEVDLRQFVLFLGILSRVLPIIFLAPVTGHQSVHVVVKLALGMFVGLVLTPVLQKSIPVLDLEASALVLLALREIGLGLLIGFASTLVFVGVRFAGDLVATETGLSMATMFDPESGSSNPVIAQFFTLFATLIFLAINGHHFLLEAIVLSYHAVPIGQFALTGALTEGMISMTGMVFITAVKFAAPIMVAQLLTNVALAVLSRVMPQMNIFIVSMPLKIAVGLLVLVSSAPLLLGAVRQSLLEFESSLVELLRLM
jgi:flagellar biosynthetic protein FliR